MIQEAESDESLQSFDRLAGLLLPLHTSEKVTSRLRRTASARAFSSPPAIDIAALRTCMFIIHSRTSGMAPISSRPATASATISSISVKPRSRRVRGDRASASGVGFSIRCPA